MKKFEEIPKEEQQPEQERKAYSPEESIPRARGKPRIFKPEEKK